MLNVTSLYAPNGQLVSEHTFDGQTPHGIWRELYASGAISRVLRFAHGRKHGVQESYYENGQLRTREHFVNGQRDGETLLYWPSGRLKRRALFAAGRLTEDAMHDA